MVWYIGIMMPIQGNGFEKNQTQGDGSVVFGVTAKNNQTQGDGSTVR